MARLTDEQLELMADGGWDTDITMGDMITLLAYTALTLRRENERLRKEQDELAEHDAKELRRIFEIAMGLGIEPSVKSSEDPELWRVRAPHELIEEMASRVVHAESDRDRAEAIADGTWPSSMEQPIAIKAKNAAIDAAVMAIQKLIRKDEEASRFTDAQIRREDALAVLALRKGEPDES